MPHDRFFIDAPLAQNQTVVLEDVEFHHLQVMRIKENERIELVNGQGMVAEATVVALGKKNGTLRVESLSLKPKPAEALILAQALTRANRLDFIIEKGTELGMTDLWLFPAFLSEKKEVNLERARQIAIAAMKQSGRLYLPKIEFYPSLQKCPMRANAYYGDVSASPLAYRKGSATLFIGPEKGFAEKEIEWLKEQGAIGVKLNANILRSDTAALAGLTVLSYLALG